MAHKAPRNRAGPDFEGQYGIWFVMSVAVVRSLLLLVLSLFWAGAAGAASEPYRVLLLHSFRSSLPVTVDWYQGLVRGFASVPDVPVEINSEFPDLARFEGGQQFDWLIDFYRKSYQQREPNLIISTDTPALRFLLAYGDDLFPGVPIVFVDADRNFVAAQKLPPNITGITDFLDITGTLELALRLHPNTQRVAVIVGSSQYDRGFERVARQAIESFAGRVKFVWLRGMPVDELVEALNALPERTVALYLIQMQDQTGELHVPRATLQAFSAAANVPVYGLWDTLLEHGIVGGRLVTVEEDGYQAAKMAVRILRGEPPADLPVVDRLANPAIFDGVELARWNIKENRLPAGSQVRHRPVSIWTQYRAEILATVAVIVAQGIMIAALLLNRRRFRRAQSALQDEQGRRTQAETIAAGLRGRLARFSKERSLGTMVAFISHEINQPLIAIQNYAQAAKRRLQRNVEDKPKLIELFAKIEGQAERAGAITQRVRSLVNSGEPQLSPCILNPLLGEVIGIMEPEAENRGFHITWEPAGDLPAVLADALQVQLVLVNLLQNAMQSVDSGDHYDKRLSIEVRQINNREVRVSVTDWGPGVSPERVADIFEPLYSGNSGGMGMGLAICRAIIEAHGGRLWYEPNPVGGAVFLFTLPTVGSQA
jgi:signal transduction histidine kinase